MMMETRVDGDGGWVMVMASLPSARPSYYPPSRRGAQTNETAGWHGRRVNAVTIGQARRRRIGLPGSFD